MSLPAVRGSTSRFATAGLSQPVSPGGIRVFHRTGWPRQPPPRSRSRSVWLSVAAGKPAAKKDLGLMAMTYGNVYVAKIAMGANDQHTLRAILEAEAYDGPSLIIAYSHCIAHGINMGRGMKNQKAAVDSGYWQLYRFNPELAEERKNPFKLDSKGLKIPLKDYAYMETRYKMLTKSHPKIADELIKEAQEDVTEKWKEYERLASWEPDKSE